jgi:hypothetical protein
MSCARTQDAFRDAHRIRLDDDARGKKLGSARLQSGSISAFFELEPGGSATGRTTTGGAWEANIPANMATA